jgi:two-component system cell cycle sensor histidine kinase/response regulator CckA
MGSDSPLSQLNDTTESVLRAIFVHASDAIGLSQQHVIRVVNPSMVRLFGCEREDELIGRSFLELMAPESAAELRSFVEKRARGESVPGQYRARALRRGVPFEVEIVTTMFVQEGQEYTLALLREVGAEQRAAAELYEAIFRRNTAVKLLIDPSDGSIVDANEAAAEFYGWPLEMLRQMQVYDINTLTPQEIAQEMEAARTGKRRYFRFRHRTASEVIRSVEIHSGSVEVGGRTLLLSIVQDTSERDELEEQLRQVMKLEAIGRLAGGVAHDFNNLLTIVMSCAELVQRELPPDGRGVRLMNDLMQAAERASELTGQLLSVGQRQHLAPRPVRLDEVIEDMRGLLSRAIGASMELRLELARDLVVEVDPRQLEQVVLNLVMNAHHAASGKGQIEILAEAQGQYAALRVRDHGRGMDEATRARIFEPFFTTRAGGKGLGLASVYGIVTQSGGRVSVESAPGLGSTFTVLLPRQRVEPTREEPDPLGTLEGSARVLLVDDEPQVLSVLRMTLGQAGFAVTALGSGEQALALPDEQLLQHDVLVTDQVMSGVSGVEVGRLLVARHPRLRVVLISGHGDVRERRALPEGSAVLQKPFSGAELERTLRQLLGEGH